MNMLGKIPMLELRLLFGFAKVTTGKNNFSCNKETKVGKRRDISFLDL